MFIEEENQTFKARTRIAFMTIEKNVHLSNRFGITSKRNEFGFRSFESNFVGVKPCSQA